MTFFVVFIGIFQLYIGGRKLVVGAKGVPASKKVKNHCSKVNVCVVIDAMQKLETQYKPIKLVASNYVTW